MTKKIARLLAIDDSIYWSDWRDTILFEGEKWEPHPFSVDQLKVGEIDSVRVRVTIYDKENAIKDISRSTGITGTICQVRMVMLEDGSTAWEEDEEYAQIILPINECSGQFPDVILDISAKFGWKRTGGIPPGDKTCRHVFKGLRCKYSGSDTGCPRDYEHCRTIKLNGPNFGGYRFAQDAGTVIDLGPTSTILPGSGAGGRIGPGYLGGDPGVEQDPTPHNPRPFGPNVGSNNDPPPGRNITRRPG